MVEGHPDSRGFVVERKRLVIDAVWPLVRSSLVLKAFEEVDRGLFVPPGSRSEAYTNQIVGLDGGATNSQPSLTGLMIDHLGLVGGEKVLEVGTASGYSAAVLSRIASKVHTLERDEILSMRAQERLDNLGFDNVLAHLRDGALGLPEEAPFDAIFVTAAARRLPPALIDQLADEGRIVIPLGKDLSNLEMIVGLRVGDEIFGKVVDNCRFMPLISNEPGCWTEDQLERVEKAKLDYFYKTAKAKGLDLDELRQITLMKTADRLKNDDEVDRFIARNIPVPDDVLSFLDEEDSDS